MRGKRIFNMSEDPFYNPETVASSTECTGLIPGAVQDEAQAEAYAALCAVHKQKPANNKRKKR
ncbi:MAG: hypothetical protein LBS72_10320 [Oscillospiraceae bacterium]|nr:hypothetical protein [Oscillospiraceae bacterium]